MSFDNLLVERDGRTGLLTIQRPQRLNALDARTLDEMQQALLAFQQDDDIRCVILTGAGEKAFVAGADINEIAGDNPEAARRRALAGQRVFDLIEQLGKPVIAAVNGFALGGGCELAMACHLRVASEQAKFGQPEVKLGIAPGYGGTVRLPRLVGKGRALELLLTGEMLDAQEALRIGLVNRVVPADRLLAETEAILRTILANGPLAIRACLEAVDNGSDMTVDQALLLEANYFGLLSATEDMREGTRAFIEKRKPSFKAM